MNMQPITNLSIEGIEPNIVYALLPESLKDIVDLIGIEHTIALINVHGGTHVYIPHHLHAPANFPIAQLIGQDAFRVLTLRWGGDHLQIPKADALARLIRNMQIQQLAATHTRKELAIQYNMTERAIRDILTQPVPALMGRKPQHVGGASRKDQLDLFKTEG